MSKFAIAVKVIIKVYEMVFIETFDTFSIIFLLFIERCVERNSHFITGKQLSLSICIRFSQCPVQFSDRIAVGTAHHVYSATTKSLLLLAPVLQPHLKSPSVTELGCTL